MTKNNRYSNTAYLALCGLFAALTALCSYINIPLGFTPVPMNLATLSVFLAGGLLGMKYGTLSMAVYVLMGAAGIPVFAGFQAGIGILAGPTGGFLAGYILAAFIVGMFLQKSTIQKGTMQRDSSGDMQTSSAAKRGGEIALCMAAMFIGLAACYFMGTVWFMVSTNTGFVPALIACVLPFIPGDVIKIVIATLLIRRLRPVIW